MNKATVPDDPIRVVVLAKQAPPAQGTLLLALNSLGSVTTRKIDAVPISAVDACDLRVVLLDAPDELTFLDAWPQEWLAHPLLLVVPFTLEPRPLLRHDAIDHIGPDATFEELTAKLHSLLARRGRLLDLIKRFEPHVAPLVHDATCEWVRSRVGITGLVSIPSALEALALEQSLAHKIAEAHAALDALPHDMLSTEDLWNLLLLISLPWSLEEAGEEQGIHQILADFARDLVGSRKVLLWRRDSPLDHLGIFTAGQHVWMPSSADPLREELRAAARDDAERDALEGVVFKKRILEPDLDHVIHLLSREDVTQ